MHKYYGNETFNLHDAYNDCKSVFEGLTEEISKMQILDSLCTTLMKLCTL